MGVKGLLYLFVLLVASVSLVSYKKGVYLIWLSFLFIPSIILEQWLKFTIPVMTVLMLGSVISEMRFSERRLLWKDFFSGKEKGIIAYLFVSLVVIFLSQTVPVGIQLRGLLNELAMLSFAIQTFMLVKTEEGAVLMLKRFVSCAVVFNVVYCVIFEIIVGVNPAGLPLYILLGVDNNDFITDMIDLERGSLSFRAQTIYRHSLSLGQYMLVFLPLFLKNEKQTVRFVYIVLIAFLIVVSGSRSAMVPMLLLFLLDMKGSVKSLVPKLLVLVVVCIFAFGFLPSLQQKKIIQKVEPFVASLQFWDDDKQSQNDISGSTMQMRFDQFDAALVEIEDNPFFGRGYDYRDYYILKHNDLHPELLGFESVLLLYLVERGWIGLVFFFLMAYYIYRIFTQELNERRIIKLVFVGYITSIIMTGVRPLTLLFVCLVCSIAYGITSKEKEIVPETTDSQE